MKCCEKRLGDIDFDFDAGDLFSDIGDYSFPDFGDYSLPDFSIPDISDYNFPEINEYSLPEDLEMSPDDFYDDYYEDTPIYSEPIDYEETYPGGGVIQSEFPEPIVYEETYPGGGTYEPTIYNETPTVLNTEPPVIEKPGDFGIDIGKIFGTVANVGGQLLTQYYRYQQMKTPGGGTIYNPQRLPNTPPGTRYDASGRLVYTATGQPVRVNSNGQILDTFGRVISQQGIKYDRYGRPLTTINPNGSLVTTGNEFTQAISNVSPTTLAVAGVGIVALLGLLTTARKK